MRTFRIIYTSDIHGRLFDAPGTASLESAGRTFKKDGNTLVLDGGDILQGGTAGAFISSRNPSTNPFAQAMNTFGYDAMTIGNHDTNFGLGYLAKFLEDFNGICLCANLKDRDDRLPVCDTHVFTLQNGLRIGVFGITSPHIAQWEAPDIASHLTVTSAFEAAARCVQSLRGACDVVVCIYHGGFESERVDTGDENQALKLCTIPGLDLLLTAHHHQRIARMAGGTFAVQPGSHARTFAEITGRVTGYGVSMSARFPEVKPCAHSSGGREYCALRLWEMKVLCSLDTPLPARDRVQSALYGSPLADFINDVLLEVSGAQLSMIHISGSSKGLPRTVRIKDIFESCYNANCLCTIEVTGEVLRRVLEWSACAFTVKDGRVCEDGGFLEGIRHLHHFQFIRGLKYSFDFSRPRMGRLACLQCLDGALPGQYRDVRQEDRFTMCLSSYHRYGGDGYAFFKDCPLIAVHQAPIYSYIIDTLRKER